MATPKWLGERVRALNDEDKLELMEELIAAPSETSLEQSGLVSPSDFLEEAQERYKLFGRMQGTSTGYPSLDGLCKGLVGGELIVIAGGESQGKTTLALNISNNVALNGHNVLFVTLEMTKAELVTRYMAINGGDTPELGVAFAHTVFQERDELDWKAIDKLIQTAVHEFKAELVVIDNLQYFNREIEHESQMLGRITKEFKKNAIRHNVPIILICELRKMERGEKISNQSLRGSSFIAYDGDVILLVARPENEPEYFVIKCSKNRNRGRDPSNDTIKLYFERIKLYEYKPIVDPFSR